MDIRQIADHDLEFFGDVAQLLDQQLDALDADIAEHEDPDSFGLFDRMESLLGLGFIAAQNYLIQVVGERRRPLRERYFALGPRSPVGSSLAEVIYAASNYAKHHPEPLANKTTIAILESFGVWSSSIFERSWRQDYPLSHLFLDLMAPRRARLSEVAKSLEEWRDAVIADEYASRAGTALPSAS